MSYTQENFGRLIDELWGQSGALMRSKGEEYASDADRLGNFRRIATTAGLPPERVALVLLAKHVDSLTQGVQKGAPFVWATEDGKEGMKQRLADLINYCFLLGANLEAAEREKPTVVVNSIEFVETRRD